MQTLFWLISQLFNSRKNEQERIDWDWFWRVEFPEWWVNLCAVKSAQHCVQWTLALVRRNDESSDDDIPF